MFSAGSTYLVGMTETRHLEHGRAFRSLHRNGEILVLPNAWDGVSAKLFEREGFAAIGTTSSGIAWSHGVLCGEQMVREEFVRATARITQLVEVPATADIESGFGSKPEEAAIMARDVYEAGAVGINIEDAMAEPAVLADKIRAIRESVSDEGPGLFINARTDVYLQASAQAEDDLLREAIHRLQAYEAAGADGVFVPGLIDPESIATIVREVSLPLNVYALPGTPSIAELQDLGVTRLSVGCGPLQALLARARNIAQALKAGNGYQIFTEDWLSPAEIAGLFH